MEQKTVKLRKVMFARTYKQRVSCLIRERYTIDDEIAIIRQKYTKPEEFAEYDKFCEECKTLAKNGGFNHGKNA